MKDRSQSPSQSRSTSGSESQSGSKAPSGSPSASIIRQLPDWVADAAVARNGPGYLVLLTRDPGATGQAGGQFVADLPAGRYLVETLDVDGAAWFSRESAAGGPLVAGLVCPGSAILLRIRRVE